MKKRVSECELCGHARCYSDYCFRMSARMVWSRNLDYRVWLDRSNRLLLMVPASGKLPKDQPRDTGVGLPGPGIVIPGEGVQSTLFDDDELSHRDPTW